MANVDAPFGLRPVRHRNGAPYNAAVTPYFIPSSYAVALFIGDPVVKTGTSNTAQVSGENGIYKAGSLPEINKATAGDGNALTGVVVGFEVLPSALSQTHNSASTERVALVLDDPDALFEIQSDDVADLAATDIGLNANLIFTDSGDTNTGFSGVELDTDVSSCSNHRQLSNPTVTDRLSRILGSGTRSTPRYGCRR